MVVVEGAGGGRSLYALSLVYQEHVNYIAITALFVSEVYLLITKLDCDLN